MANVLMEAMAAGLPSVATRIAGSTEAVVDGATGLLVPPNDATALARALQDLITHPERRAGFGRAARTRVVETFNWPVIAQAWLDIVERVLHNKPS